MKLLKVTSEFVPFGIYAIKRNDYVEMLNRHCETLTAYNEIKEAYELEGFEVFGNCPEC